jgi:hypothetical protein
MGSNNRNFVAKEECPLSKSAPQKNGAFWEHIFDYFNSVAPLCSWPMWFLESNWGAIKHDVSKFSRVQQQKEELRYNKTLASDN